MARVAPSGRCRPSAFRPRRRCGRVTNTVAALAHELSVAVYFAVYRAGEVEALVAADAPGAQAVVERADFREAAHAHVIGQCLLAHLDEVECRDHFARCPMRPRAPNSGSHEADFRRRLAARRRFQPVCEQGKYAPGTLCVAFPAPAAYATATLAVSAPSDKAERLRPAVNSLRSRVGALISSLSFSISI
ncbi:DNA-binding IclR family transcriptional regulator [Streptomyces zagrosensis]|uniref:DNA-binding IclR family transcriptional regulator n=1 Tax=Streptomyces zagrosensis TaxID=1042984 RepID=A0A7W9Q5Y4_9ACTN|nr:DNA-binding IclR family transcriptional regulator [Streptomyces zagrosensis]